MRFVLRLERSGGYLFDRLVGQAVFVAEGHIARLAAIGDCRVIAPGAPRESLPADCHAAPSKVFLELTGACNLRCPICYKSATDDSRDELTREEVLMLIDDLADAGVFELRVTGGEPTLRRDFMDVVERADARGLYVSVGTNGLWSRTLRERIIVSCIASVTVSIDGDEASHDAIRGRGTYRATTETLAELSGRTQKKLVLNFTAGRHNAAALPAVVALADSLRVAEVRVAPVRPHGRASGGEAQLLQPVDYLRLVEGIERLRATSRVAILTYFDILGTDQPIQDRVVVKSCPAGVASCVVSARGDVYGCALCNAGELSAEGQRTFRAGNVRQERLMDIWLDSTRWQAHRQIGTCRSKTCRHCRHYGVRCFGNCVVSSWLHAGRVDAEDPYCFASLLPVPPVEPSR